MFEGKGTTLTSGEDLTLLARNISELASEGFETVAVNLEEHTDTITKNSTNGDIDLNSSKNVKSTTGSKSSLH